MNFEVFNIYNVDSSKSMESNLSTNDYIKCI